MYSDDACDEVGSDQAESQSGSDLYVNFYASGFDFVLLVMLFCTDRCGNGYGSTAFVGIPSAFDRSVRGIWILSSGTSKNDEKKDILFRLKSSCAHILY